MLVVDLHCAHGHHFEGWFASADDLASQKARGLLSCPVCGDADVTRRPSAPHLNTSHLKDKPEPAGRCAPQSGPGPAGREPERGGAAVMQAAPSAPAPAAAGGSAEQAAQMMEALQSLYLKAVRHVVEHTEDVGERFAQEARSIHHGDAPERAIRGQASAEEKEALRDEGIDFMTLPIPDGFKGPLQ
jgi:hypothetical protein